MQIEVHIDQADIDQMSDEVAAEVAAAKQAAQGAGAEAYFAIVRGNFGDTGVDRALSWAPLSWAYATQVGRKHATLFVTGKLESAVKFDNSNPEEGVVSISDNDCPYALAHQYGYPPKNLPARPYFPFNPYSGETTPFALSAVGEAMERTLAEVLR